MPIEITTPAPAEIRPSLELLLGRIPSDDLTAQVDSLLAAVTRGEVSLEGLQVARRQGQIVGAVLAVCQPDGTAHVWPPGVAADAPPETGLMLAKACRDWVDRSTATIAQCLTQLDDRPAQQLLKQAGFEHLTDLVCWQHALEEVPHAPLPEDCEILQFSQENAAHFERVMERTYDGSQDCAALRGRRSARDSLAAHQLAADPESRLWKLYRCRDEDVGVVLCADHRDQGMWELLYLGVVTKFRQQGFGLAMLCEALLDAKEAGAEGLFLAADDANEAAANLYAACGFSVGFRQRIHVWFPDRAVRM